MRQARQAIPRTRLTGSLRRDSVKKNVAAIHISGKLTLLQRKLSNVLLLNAYDHLTSRASHAIDAKTLCLMIGYNSNDMDTLKAALRSLAETTAEWDMLDEDGRQEWGVSSLVSYAKLKGGVCEYAYSPLLAEKLYDPKIFALINLDIQRRFTSGHGLALYENCYRFVRTGSTGWWDIALFRRLMGVDDSVYYENFKHLNAKIIKPAVAEVNKTSNIAVEAEFAKRGRNVAQIRFRIRENPQLAMFEIDDSAGMRTSGTYAALIAQGVSDRLSRQWIAEHGEDYVAGKLALVAERGRAGAIRATPAAYLSAAIREDYALAPASVPRDPEALTRAAAETAAAAEARGAEEDARDVARRLRLARQERVLATAGARNATQRDADKRLFAATLDNDLDREHFRANGWQSALCARAICTFWEQMAPGVFDGLEGEA